MTSTTVMNSTAGQIIYLPMPQAYGGILNSWTTSTTTWTQSNLVFDENGSKIVDQISKMQTFLVKYKALINGVIYEELIEKLNNLFYKISCMWGLGFTGSQVNLSGSTRVSTSTPIWNTSLTYTYPMTGQCTSGYSWVVDNSTTTSTTGITTYSY